MALIAPYHPVTRAKGQTRRIPWGRRQTQLYPGTYLIDAPTISDEWCGTCDERWNVGRRRRQAESPHDGMAAGCGSGGLCWANGGAPLSAAGTPSGSIPEVLPSSADIEHGPRRWGSARASESRTARPQSDRRTERGMISTQPNLVYLKAAWAAFAGISGENCHQTYDEAGLTFERINHSAVVRKNKIQVSTMPLQHTRQELRMGFLGRIEMEARKAAAEVEAVLHRDLALPDDHTMIVMLEESMRSLRRNGGRALSILIGPMVHADDPAPIHIEIRVFLDAPRACIFAHQTMPTVRGEINLLANVPKRECHPRATTYIELAQRIAATINTTISTSSATQLTAHMHKRSDAVYLHG